MHLVAGVNPVAWGDPLKLPIAALGPASVDRPRVHRRQGRAESGRRGGDPSGAKDLEFLVRLPWRATKCRTSGSEAPDNR